MLWSLSVKKPRVFLPWRKPTSEGKFSILRSDFSQVSKETSHMKTKKSKLEKFFSYWKNKDFDNRHIKQGHFQWLSKRDLEKENGIGPMGNINGELVSCGEFFQILEINWKLKVAR